MDDILSINDLKKLYPEAVSSKNGVDTIDFLKLSLILLTELRDIQDQLGEKDYQILRITEKLDSLS